LHCASPRRDAPAPQDERGVSLRRHYVANWVGGGHG
jgi:hypothetical protein